MPANAPTLVAPSTRLEALVPTEVELRLSAVALAPSAVPSSPLAKAPAPTAVLPLPVAPAWQFTLESKSVLALLPELQPATAVSAKNVGLAIAQPTSNATKCFRVVRFIIQFILGTVMIVPRYDNRPAPHKEVRRAALPSL